MRDIARVAGVHQTTVSLALRNRPSLPEATRKRIQDIATEMGYRPDPVLSALNNYRHPAADGAIVLSRFSMAYLTDGNSADSWRRHMGLAACRSGAMRRAEELGYHLEDFWFDRRGMTPKRVAQILQTRNISGIIIAPLMGGDKLNMLWEHFSWVSITSSLTSPELYTIRNDHLESVRLAHRSLRRLGYRRIGLAIAAYSDARMQNMCSTGIWGEEGFLPAKERVPIYCPKLWNIESFGKWFYKNRPDVLLSITPHLEEIIAWLKAEGLRVPEDIGLASLGSKQIGHISGIVQSPELIGATAVEVLGGVLQHNDIGIPKNPQTTLIKSTWMPGQTTRQ